MVVKLTNYKIQAHEDIVVIGRLHTFGKSLLATEGKKAEWSK